MEHGEDQEPERSLGEALVVASASLQVAAARAAPAKYTADAAHGCRRARPLLGRKRACFALGLSVLLHAGAASADVCGNRAGTSAQTQQSVAAMPYAQGLLWEVTTEGRANHLFGTVHVRDRRVFRFPDAMQAAMDKLAGEVEKMRQKEDSSIITPGQKEESRIIIPGR